MVGVGDRFIADGRIDVEKLHELLQVGGEVEGLDFKATLDLQDPKHEIEHIKDLLALMSLPTGGYVVIGVHESGFAATEHPLINRRQFDQATLTQKVQAFTRDRIDLRSAVHSIAAPNGQERLVALVYAGPPPSLLPIVVTKQGEFTKPNGGQEIVFRVGQVIVRDGTTTTELAARFWEPLLARYTEKIRDETRRDVDALVHRIVEMLGSSSATEGTSARAAPPIDFGMDTATFEEAAAQLMESNNSVRFNRLLVPAGELINAATSSGDQQEAESLLDRIFILATSAMLYGSQDQFSAVIASIQDYYDSIPEVPDATQLNASDHRQRATAWRDVVVRLYLLGSLAVRKKKWWHLRELVLHRHQVTPTYSYASWIRHGLTSAARANVLDHKPKMGGALISRARDLATQIQPLRPDLPVIPSVETRADGEIDRLMDTLCQFDVLWCIIAQTDSDRPGMEDFYPSSAAFHQWRVDEAFNAVATDDKIRHKLFRNRTDSEIAAAIQKVYQAAARESWNYGGMWTSLPIPAANYVNEHLRPLS